MKLFDIMIDIAAWVLSPLAILATVFAVSAKEPRRDDEWMRVMRNRKPRR